MKPTTKATFEQDVLKSKKVVLLDVWAPWCGPCRSMEPILELVEKEVKDWVDIYKLDVSTEMDLAQELGVSSIPTFLIYKDGKVVGSSSTTTKDNLIDLLSQAR